MLVNRSELYPPGWSCESLSAGNGSRSLEREKAFPCQTYKIIILCTQHVCAVNAAKNWPELQQERTSYILSDPK